MASSISICFFSPQALARSNGSTRNPSSRPLAKRLSKSKSNPNPNPKHHNRRARTASRDFPPSPPSSAGCDATTYTRLPPKEDFFLHSFDPSYQSAAEVKLSESTATTRRSSRRGTERESDRLSNGEESFHTNLGLSYGKFEVFEVNSDPEDEDDNHASKLNARTRRVPRKGVKPQISGLISEEEVFDANLGLSHEKFELFEVNSDPEDEDEDDEGDYDEDDNVGNVLGFSGGEAEDVFSGGEIEGEEVKVKEKGVPAVMRCFDRAKIYVKAGDGGNGVVAFRREKYVPFGGPSGGDGGRGGNVYVEVDGSMNSLLPFRQSIHFRAGRGHHGQGRKQNGAKGENVVVKVPPGTVIREAAEGETGKVLLELLYPGQRARLLPGGRGGRGNASFKSGTNKVPKIAENGEEGLEMWLELELKLVADVGIVGAPNAGKSTYLSVISAAQPAIANYPFTTLLPNLGVVSFDYDTTVVVADLPGLLEGAHRGFGLGHEFLRHTERCSALVHVVDGSSQQPEYEFDAVRLELELFSPELAEKPYLVAYNKMDLPEASEKWISFKEKLQAHGIEPFCMSAVKGEGTHEVICAAYELVRKIREEKEEGWSSPENLNHVADMVQKQRAAPIDEFEISHDSSTGTWHVVGSGLQRFIQMTNWRYQDSERRFQHVMEACGLYKSLIRHGVKEGDTVIVSEMEMVWHDSADNSYSNLRTRSSDSNKWVEWT